MSEKLHCILSISIYWHCDSISLHDNPHLQPLERSDVRGKVSFLGFQQVAHAGNLFMQGMRAIQNFNLFEKIYYTLHLTNLGVQIQGKKTCIVARKTSDDLIYCSVR